MPVSVNVSGAWKNVATTEVKVSGVWKTAQVFTNVGGVWKSINVLSATVNDTAVEGTTAAPGGAISTTSTASGVDGSGSYTYAWQYVSGDADVTCNSPSTAGTAWLYSDGSPGTRFCTWRCAVSDGVDTAYTPNVSITLELT